MVSELPTFVGERAADLPYMDATSGIFLYPRSEQTRGTESFMNYKAGHYPLQLQDV